MSLSHGKETRSWREKKKNLDDLEKADPLQDRGLKDKKQHSKSSVRFEKGDEEQIYKKPC